MLANAEKTRIGVLYLVALVDSLGFNIFSNVLPVLADSSDPRHHEGSEALSPGTAYSILQFTFCIGVAIFPPFAGRLSDSRGRRPILLISLAMLCASYFAQGYATQFWSFAFVRIIAGVSGCLRPLAIAYMADMFTEDGRRCKAITSLTLLGAIAVGFGPTLGAHFLEMDRSYPFYFMGGMSFLSLILVLLFLPEAKASKVILSIPNTPRCGLNRRRYIWTYRYLLALGFTTYFGAMLAAIAFPLSLKDDFHLDPVPAAMCSIADGPLIFLSNFLFMQYLTTMSRGCKASVIASASFLLVGLVPTMLDMASLPGFLAIKYSTSISGPIVFSAIAQTMMTVCPRNVCGSYAGLLTFYHGVGRLAATGVVGPLYHFDQASVYLLVASMGGISALLFLLLGHDLRKSKTPEDVGLAFLSESSESVASRQLSLLYPGTPAGGEVRIIARD